MAGNIAWIIGGALGFFIVGEHVSNFLESVLDMVLPSGDNGPADSDYTYDNMYESRDYSDSAGDHY